jgi:hypothetical protein
MSYRFSQVGCAALIALLGSGLRAQNTAAIQGTVLDAKTLKPVAAAWVMANRAGAPPFSGHTKSGGDGTFSIRGLAAGKYSICVQAAGDAYLDPCQWSGSPVTVTLAAGQTSAGNAVRLAPASILTVQIQDPQRALSQKTKDGRQPELRLGVWGPRGLYYPAHPVGGPAPGVSAQGTVSYSYRLAVPLDTALSFYAASHDVKLGDGNGLPLAGNLSQQAFQHATGDPNPKGFALTVLGLAP